MNEEYTNPFWTNMPTWGKNAAGALGGGLSAISQPHEGFMPGQFSAQQGAMQGYAAGGAYGALAGAIAAPVSQVVKSHRNLDNLNTTVGATSFDAYGRPVYNGSEVINAVNKLPELQKTAKWDSTNILGLGRKAERKKNALIDGVRTSHQNFNQSEGQFRNRQIQMQEFYERMNRNLY